MKFVLTSVASSLGALLIGFVALSTWFGGFQKSIETLENENLPRRVATLEGESVGNRLIRIEDQFSSILPDIRTQVDEGLALIDRRVETGVDTLAPLESTGDSNVSASGVITAVNNARDAAISSLQHEQESLLTGLSNQLELLTAKNSDGSNKQNSAQLVSLTEQVNTVQQELNALRERFSAAKDLTEQTNSAPQTQDISLFQARVNDLVEDVKTIQSNISTTQEATQKRLDDIEAALNEVVAAPASPPLSDFSELAAIFQSGTSDEIRTLYASVLKTDYTSLKARARVLALKSGLEDLQHLALVDTLSQNPIINTEVKTEKGDIYNISIRVINFDPATNRFEAKLDSSITSSNLSGAVGSLVGNTISVSNGYGSLNLTLSESTKVEGSIGYQTNVGTIQGTLSALVF